MPSLQPLVLSFSEGSPSSSQNSEEALKQASGWLLVGTLHGAASEHVAPPAPSVVHLSELSELAKGQPPLRASLPHLHWSFFCSWA